MTSLGKLIKTADGSLSLIHPEHDECYHSHGGALWEAQSLYCQASGIVNKFASDLSPTYVLDVGLGLAYNACSTIDAWFCGSGSSDLEIHSLEINADLVSALIGARGEWQESWPDNWRDWCCSLSAQDEQTFQAQINHPTLAQATCRWFIYVGDGISTIKALNVKMSTPWDFIWQDPFSPEKNPRMWNEDWFKLLSENSNQKTQLLTYSVARVVKNALMGAGWTYEKVKATGPKRHWLRASVGSLQEASPFQSR
ncbi:MAG: MnmC family methyltransferase [Oligoflexales bacterium]